MKDAAGAWCVRDVLDPAYVTANSTRNLLYAGNWQAVLGKRGYAAVISREEDALCIVDLSSIFEYIRQSWMSSMESFKTTFAAREKGTWPETFEQRPDLIPRITVQKTLARPVSVLAGHQVGRWGTDRLKMHIGLEAGEVITLDASPIMAEYSWQKRGTVMGAQLSSVFVGKNPIHMCFGRTNDGSEVEELYPGTQTSDGLNNVVWVACRGDKKVVELLTHMAKSKVYRTIEDQRMNDPVAVHKNVRGPILNVADFAGKQIIGFRVGPLRNSRVTPAIDYPTAEGKAPIEITGFLKVPGNVYHINGDNVN